jgi:hypothetical protein
LQWQVFPSVLRTTRKLSTIPFERETVSDIAPQRAHSRLARVGKTSGREGISDSDRIIHAKGISQQLWPFLDGLALHSGDHVFPLPAGWPSWRGWLLLFLSQRQPIQNHCEARGLTLCRYMHQKALAVGKDCRNGFSVFPAPIELVNTEYRLTISAKIHSSGNSLPALNC